MNAPDFTQASQEALGFLHSRLGMDLWMVTRTDHEDWIVLSARDTAYGIQDGDTFRWADSFCSRMVTGDGPRVAPDANSVAAFDDCGIRRGREIGAYLGVPLRNDRGELFGTLCALARQPVAPSIAQELPMVELFADMLSGLLSAELQTAALTRDAETHRGEQHTDALTGLANQRGWDIAVAAEEERCRRYGASACVIAVGLPTGSADEDADTRLLHAAQVLRQIVRRPDTLARVDEHLLLILGVECTSAEALALLRRLDQGLGRAGIASALGMAMRHRTSGLRDACDHAVAAMEEHQADRARS